MTITAVGAAVTGGGALTLAFTPTAGGDVLAFSYFGLLAAVISSVSGGGVTTWNNAADHVDTTNAVAAGTWWGVVGTAGPATITISGGGYTAGGISAMWCRQFHSTLAGWLQVTSSPAPGTSGAPSGSGLPVTYPGLSPGTAPDNLYIGAAWSIYGNMTAGSTAGVTYEAAGGSAQQACYDLAVTAPLAPAATQSNTGSYDAGAVILSAGAAAAAPSYLGRQQAVTTAATT